MNTAQPIAGSDSRVIPLTARRTRRFALSYRMVKAIAIFALCLLGLIGSFADDAVARTGLLLVTGGDSGDAGGIDNLTATLVWAAIANLAVCAGVVLAAYWLITRPTAQVVELRTRRYKD
jgi:hypothetical protein